MKKFILALAIFATATTVSIAQNAPATDAPKTEQKQRGKSKAPQGHAKVPNKNAPKGEAKSDQTMYGCPMKCVAPSATAGKCGKCGMDLVALAKPEKGQAPKDGHKHGEGHKGGGERKQPKQKS